VSERPDTRGLSGPRLLREAIVPTGAAGRRARAFLDLTESSRQDYPRSGRALRFGRFVRNNIRLRAAWLDRLFPPPAPVPAFRKGVNVLLARTEEIQKVHA
jgi:hypothetical protein